VVIKKVNHSEPNADKFVHKPQIFNLYLKKYNTLKSSIPLKQKHNTDLMGYWIPSISMLYFSIRIVFYKLYILFVLSLKL